MAKLPLSVCMISGAEAGRIGRALQSVTDRVGEVIVVLNEDVRDGTDALCEAQGAKVYREPWKGFVGQKNSAAAKASTKATASTEASAAPTVSASISSAITTSQPRSSGKSHEKGKDT